MKSYQDGVKSIRFLDRHIGAPVLSRIQHYPIANSIQFLEKSAMREISANIFALTIKELCTYLLPRWAVFERVKIEASEVMPH